MSKVCFRCIMPPDLLTQVFNISLTCAVTLLVCLKTGSRAAVTSDIEWIAQNIPQMKIMQYSNLLEPTTVSFVTGKHTLWLFINCFFNWSVFKRIRVWRYFTIWLCLSCMYCFQIWGGRVQRLFFWRLIDNPGEGLAFSYNQIGHSAPLLGPATLIYM